MTSSVTRVAIVCAAVIATASCFQFPDISSVFSPFYGGAKVKDDTDDDVRSRVKRQDPGIGDESTLPHLIRAASLPMKPDSDDEINDRYMPTLGNGHLATTVYDDFIYLNGLYNGAGSESHRAVIPAIIMSRIKIANEDVEDRATRKYHLNAEEGYFMETIDCDFAWIEHKLYVHKHFIRLFVSDLYYRPKTGSLGGGKIYLNYPSFESSADIDFNTERSYLAHYQISGRTREAEDGASTQNIHVFWMDALKEIFIGGGDEAGNDTFVMAVDRQESAAREEFNQALQILEGDKGHYRLFEQHKDAWQSVWENGRVEVVGDLQLAKLTKFAQFYIHTSLPTLDAWLPTQRSEFTYGVARNSLAKGGAAEKDYNGHVMWDNEMYIMPAMVFFHPRLIKEVLRYRSEMGESARQLAEDMGGRGYKYPYRSAFSGMEVSPGDCTECDNRKYYVSAVVAWAIRTYYSVTRDRDYLINTEYNGCDVTREIARFYADQAHYDPNTGRYAMYNMTGPDESYPDKKNNAFTIVAASLAIHWARYMACQCERNEREEVPDEWVEKALYMDIPFDNVMRLHSQFEGFMDIPSPRIRQADTVLLSYPLNWNMSRDIMRHDLEFYEQITDDLGPALTWSFFTIGWKWVEELTKRDSYFLKSYSDYTIQPFKVWTEFNERSAADQQAGSVNFLPGMGGFLQSLIFGYAGVRIRPEMLEFHNPMPPPGCASITLYSLKYMEAVLDITVEENTVTVYMIQSGQKQLVLKKNDTLYSEESINPGAYITIDNPKDGFFIYTNEPSGCEHPRDYVYMPWGYSPFVDSAESIKPLKYLHVISLLIASFCIINFRHS